MAPGQAFKAKKTKVTADGNTVEVTDSSDSSVEEDELPEEEE